MNLQVMKGVVFLYVGRDVILINKIKTIRNDKNLNFKVLLFASINRNATMSHQECGLLSNKCKCTSYI